MHKTLIALIATVLLAFVGVLVAAPKSTNGIRGAPAASAGIDIFNLTQGVRTLPEQSYPAH
jgi:hypothetical protein